MVLQVDTMGLVIHGTSELDATRGGDVRRHGAPGAVRVVLASQSPRRLELLSGRGLSVEVHLPGFEDDHLRRGGRSANDPRKHAVRPAEWVAALAYLKASATLRRLLAAHPGERFVVIGADTVVAKDGDLIGKAASPEQARAIIERLENGEHTVITGAAVVCSERGMLGGLGAHDEKTTRIILADHARVRVGSIGPARIDEYVCGDGWKGKAGAYNLRERINAGWPISFVGDPATVMGFPILRTAGLIDALAAKQPPRVHAGEGVPA